jgi:resuscitation-promoting factor RpfA
MKGRHRAPSTFGPQLIKLGTLATTTLSLPLLNVGSASAAESNGVLEVIAQCESGNSNVNTRGGSTASGFLQILDSTWKAHGGKEFASRAIHASRAQQFIVGQRILNGQGISAWNPSRSCWGGKISSAPQQTITPKKKTTESAPKIVKKVSPPAPIQSTARNAAKNYVIKSGDNLSKIARSHGTTWRHLAAINRDTVKNPNRIYTGHSLRLR